MTGFDGSVRNSAGSPAPTGDTPCSEGVAVRGRAGALAATLKRGVFDGAWKPGDRLPSVRELMATHEVSMTTAVAALRRLEDEGLIEARPRSGFWVLARPKSKQLVVPEQARLITRSGLIDAVLAERCHVKVPLGCAYPASDLYPQVGLSRALRAEAARDPSLLARAAPAEGTPALRAALARHAIAWGCHLDPDEIIVTAGAREALALALDTLCRPGDVVVVESPAYFGLLRLLEARRLRALEIPALPDHGLDLDALASIITDHRVSACVVATSASNPSGETMSSAARQRLALLLASANIPLVEDHVYGDLVFEERPVTAARAYADELGSDALLVGSLNKTLGPGLGLGWLAAGRHTLLARRLRSAGAGATPAVLQEAVAVFLEGRGLSQHSRSLRRELAHRVTVMRDAVEASFPAGTSVRLPSGGYTLWVSLPDNVEGVSLFAAAAKRGIGIAPGSMFSTTSKFDHHIRLNAGAGGRRGMPLALAELGVLIKKIADRQ